MEKSKSLKFIDPEFDEISRKNFFILPTTVEGIFFIILFCFGFLFFGVILVKISNAASNIEVNRIIVLIIFLFGLFSFFLLRQIREHRGFKAYIKKFGAKYVDYNDDCLIITRKSKIEEIAFGCIVEYAFRKNQYVNFEILEIYYWDEIKEKLRKTRIAYNRFIPFDEYLVKEINEENDNQVLDEIKEICKNNRLHGDFRTKIIEKFSGKHYNLFNAEFALNVNYKYKRDKNLFRFLDFAANEHIKKVTIFNLYGNIKLVFLVTFMFLFIFLSWESDPTLSVFLAIAFIVTMLIFLVPKIKKFNKYDYPIEPFGIVFYPSQIMILHKPNNYSIDSSAINSFEIQDNVLIRHAVFEFRTMTLIVDITFLNISTDDFNKKVDKLMNP